MSTLISTDMVTRSEHTGFEKRLSFSECNQLQEKDRVCIEPAYQNFDKATNDQLGVPFKVAQYVKEQTPRLVVMNFCYTIRNAQAAKGYWLDVVKAYKDMGYPHFTSQHIPFETYGCPMVGSVVTLIFSREPMAYMPIKRIVYPGKVFKGLLFHAPAGRVKGGAYPGMSDVSGFFNSNRHFLPDLGSWAETGLRGEYQDGNSTRLASLNDEDVLALFGVKEIANRKDLHLCTPSPILRTFIDNLSILDPKKVEHLKKALPKV